MRLETVTRGRKLGLITFIESTTRLFGIFLLGNRARSDKCEFQAFDLGTGLGFVLVHYSWSGVLPLSVANIWSITSLEKTDFYFACGYQFQIASWLGWRAMFTPHPPISAGTCSGLTLSRPCACCHWLRSYVRPSCFIRKISFPGSHLSILHILTGKIHQGLRDRDLIIKVWVKHLHRHWCYQENSCFQVKSSVPSIE